MKILFVCENYLPHYGGAEVVFQNLAEGFVKRGHEVNLVTHRMKDTPKFEVIEGVKVHRIKCWDSRYLFSFFSIPKVLKLAKKSDVIQTTTFNGAPPAWLAGKIRKKPVIITVHEVWVNKWNKVTDFGKFKCFIHNLLEKSIYRLRFDHYLCVSEATTDDLKKVINPKNHSRIKRVYNGFEKEFWDPKKYDNLKIRKKHEISQEFIYFAWGRPGTSKGFEYLVRAVPEISKKIPDSLCLLSLGSTEKYAQKYLSLMKEIEKNQLQDKIKIITGVKHSELGHYLKTADLVVVPSIAEGFGYTTLEACQMGKIVVASKAGSIPEVIGGRFVLVPPKSPESIADGVWQAYQGNYQKRELKKFDWNETIDEYLKVYELLLKR